ncbi:MAG: hypothetical protein V4773_22530 [Verrucomicrobiota bacterium]
MTARRGRLALPFLLSLFLLLATFAPAASAAEPVFRAGFAERDISPEIGMERPGGYAKAFHTRFHDPCKVRAAVFADGTRKLALVSVDALFVPRSVVLAARAEIEQHTGIAAGAIMIAATHSHSSGPVGMVQPGQFDTAPDDIRKLAYEESSLANAAYLERVTREIVAGVRAAEAVLVPAQLGFGFGHEDKAAFNRRMRMKNGQTWTMPGLSNPDIVDYAGPIDPQVGVIGAWDASGTLLGTIVNFSCHATTNPGGISANWIYYTERAIQGGLGSKAPMLFFAGPCGDIGQVDSKSPHEYRTGNQWAQFIGSRIGAEAVKVLVSVPRSASGLTLESRQKITKIARRTPAPETIVKARATVAAGKRPPDNTDWLFARETLMLTHLLATEPAAEVEVQALQIGPALFVGNPAEYFVAYGLEIKKGSPFPFTFPVELANGCVGYVPTEEALSPTGGGYETRLTFYSNLEPTAGRQIAATSISLARELKPGPVPEFARLKEPMKPWPYGNVPPELK